MAAKMAAKMLNFYSRWTRESPNTTLYGLSTAAKPFLKMALQSGHQNPRWTTKWPLQYLSFNLDGLETRESPNTILYGLSRDAKPFLKLVLQSGVQNPKWLPKWPPKWLLNDLKFNVDGLKDHLIPLCMGVSRAAKPFLKLVLQSDYHNPRWPPKWPQK